MSKLIKSIKNPHIFEGNFTMPLIFMHGLLLCLSLLTAFESVLHSQLFLQGVPLLTLLAYNIAFLPQHLMNGFMQTVCNITSPYAVVGICEFSYLYSHIGCNMSPHYAAQPSRIAQLTALQAA